MALLAAAAAAAAATAAAAAVSNANETTRWNDAISRKTVVKSKVGYDYKTE